MPGPFVEIGPVPHRDRSGAHMLGGRLDDASTGLPEAPRDPRKRAARGSRAGVPLERQRMAGIKQNGILEQLLRDSWLAFAEHLVQDRFTRINMTDEKRDILIRWKKRSDTYKLVQMKAEAIVCAARGVGLDIIAEMVERAEGTVRKWLSQWRKKRLRSGVTGHAGNENAAKLKRAQKEELEEVFSKPPSESGVKAGFWDVPALKDVVQIKFGVEYRSDSSYRLLMRFLGMSLCCPTRSTGVATRRPSPGGWPRSGTRSPICSRTAGRSTPLTRFASSTRPRPGACGFPREREQSCTWTARRRAGRSSGH